MTIMMDKSTVIEHINKNIDKMRTRNQPINKLLVKTNKFIPRSINLLSTDNRMFIKSHGLALVWVNKGVPSGGGVQLESLFYCYLIRESSLRRPNKFLMWFCCLVLFCLCLCKAGVFEVSDLTQSVLNFILIITIAIVSIIAYGIVKYEGCQLDILDRIGE